MQKLPSRQEFNAMLRGDLVAFIEWAFRELNPDTVFYPSPHIEVIADRLEKCRRRKIRRLIITLPPRSLKSHIVSVAYAAFLLGHDPSLKIICVSYGQELSDKLARDCRILMLSATYRELFPNTILSKNSINDMVTTRGGGRMSTSVGGVLTGRGADVIIIDDPQKAELGDSESDRNRIKIWYSQSLITRLNNKKIGVIIVVMQRLHQDDLVGFVKEQETWDEISFPAIAINDESIWIDGMHGRYAFHRRVGDLLQPEREPMEVLDVMRQGLTPDGFEAQYQQQPMPPEGNIIKYPWLKFFILGSLPRNCHVVQSWDTANKSGEMNDWSVCTTWYRIDGKSYLVDVHRARYTFPELKNAVRELHARYQPNVIVVEDKASGTQLLQDLSGMPLRGYTPPNGSDKALRLHMQSAEFANGLVYLPEEAPWKMEYIRELTSCPNCKYWDQVDSTTQALDYMRINKRVEIFRKLGQ